MSTDQTNKHGNETARRDGPELAPANGSAAKLYLRTAAIALLTGAVLIGVVLAALHWMLAVAWVAMWCFALAYAATECKKEAEAGSTKPPSGKVSDSWRERA